MSFISSGPFIRILLAVVLLAFEYAGISLMVHSGNIYRQSLRHAELLTGKVLHPAFQKKQAVTIPPSAYNIVKDRYSQALSFLCLPRVFLPAAVLLPRIQNLSVGPGGVAVPPKDLQQDVATLIRQAITTQEASAGQHPEDPRRENGAGSRKGISGD